jgi:hypothetical protein
MILIHKMFETLANIFNHAGLWLLVLIVALICLFVFILRLTNSPHRPRPWIVRKGECPFCGHELFGITREYQRLHLLEVLSPDSKYLCTSCDRDKVSDLLSKYR